MPRLARINIHPIKSLDGVAVAKSEFVRRGGLRYDRRFRLRNARGETVTAKRCPELLRLRAAFAPDWSTVTFSGADVDAVSFRLVGGEPGLEQWLSRHFGEPMYFDEDDDAGFPDDLDSPGPTIVSVATLEAVAAWFALDVAEVRRRFRANLEVEADAAAECPAFWEDRLFAEDATPGARDAVPFRIGTAMLHGVNPCARCPVPTRDSRTGEPYDRFAQVFGRRREETLPEWAPRTAFDHFYRLAVNTRPAPERPGGVIQVGDEVAVLS
jgi:uncharacterized protein YcbX